jgi:hypothetical protein
MSWSLPSKMTYIGTVVGILALGIYGIDKFNESMDKRMHERLFASMSANGYEVDLMHFIIKNITYKELASFNVSSNFLAVYGTKTFGGLSTLAPNETINAGIQFTPLRNGRYPASQYQIQYDLDHL